MKSAIAISQLPFPDRRGLGLRFESWSSETAVASVVPSTGSDSSRGTTTVSGMSTTGRRVVILDRAPAALPPTPRMSVLSSRRTIMRP